MTIIIHVNSTRETEVLDITGTRLALHFGFFDFAELDTVLVSY